MRYFAIILLFAGFSVYDQLLYTGTFTEVQQTIIYWVSVYASLTLLLIDFAKNEKSKTIRIIYYSLLIVTIPKIIINFFLWNTPDIKLYYIIADNKTLNLIKWGLTMAGIAVGTIKHLWQRFSKHGKFTLR